ncbi:hypothetical protein C4544_02590, partial [candidate division WS5 bacterium]
IFFNQKAEEPVPVQTEEAKEEPEVWTKNTSVLFKDTTSTCTIKINDSTYRMYLMAEGGIFYTDSTDGKTFGAKVPTGLTQTPGKMISNPSVLKVADTDWIMVYEEQPEKKPGGGPDGPPSVQTQRNLYLATSKDGKTFIKVGIAIDSSKEDNFFASVPDLIKTPDRKIRMYYVSGGEAIGSQISSDNGRTWTREAGYRLTDRAVDPDVLYEDGKWTMYYAILPLPESGSRNAIYKAVSKDGLTWEKDEAKLIEPSAEMGFVVDPDVIKTGDTYRMFFGESTGDIGAPGAINLYFADREK